MGAVTEYYYRKSGQIPAFGDWENANELPITQYFECARQAGLLRCSCSGECCGKAAAHLINSLPRRVYTAPAPAPHLKAKTRGMNKNKQGYPQTNLERKQVKVGELMNQPRTHKHHPKTAQHMIKSSISAKPKPVDEDLYKIPPELLQNSKRKKVMLGFFSKCMVPPCAA